VLAASNARPRPYTHDDLIDFYHTGPATLMGRWLRTFWHPVYRTEDLPAGSAKPVRVMGEDFTLYRGENGTAHALAFRCAHRGTQLSTGWVEGENLRCFYHGWMYDPSGQCIEQPAEPDPFCQKIRVRSYPTEEYLGLIFVHQGEDEPPELPHYPDFEGERRFVTTHVMPCNVINNLDGHPDHAHIPFVHGTRTGRSWRQTGEYGIRPVVVEEDEWGVCTLAGDNQHGMPNVLIHVRPSGTGRDDVLRWRVPIDDYTHRDFSVFTGERRAVTYTEASDRAIEVTQAVLRGELRIEEIEAQESRPCITIAQDAIAQAGIGAIPDRSIENLGREDAGLILKRRIWERELRALADGRPLKKWIRSERFYRENVRAREHDHAFVD